MKLNALCKASQFTTFLGTTNPYKTMQCCEHRLM